METKSVIKKQIEALEAAANNGVEGLFMEAKIHQEARKKLGTGYLHMWEAECGKAYGKEDAQRLRTLAGAIELQSPAVIHNLPRSVNKLRRLVVIKNVQFLIDAVQNRAIVPGMMYKDIGRLVQMYKDIGRYDPMWESLDERVAKAKAGEVEWKTQFIKNLRMQNEVLFKSDVGIESLLYRALPDNELEALNNPEAIIENIGQDLKAYEVRSKAARAVIAQTINERVLAG